MVAFAPKSFALALGLGVLGCGRIGYGAGNLASGDGGGMDAAPVSADSGSGGTDASSHDGGSLPDDASVAPDAESCTESPCRLVQPQCGCPEGRMCTRAVAGSAVRSCLANGTHPVGSACDLSAECVPGTGCVIVGPGHGTCYSWCVSSADCDGDPCTRVAVGTDVGACLRCDPVAGTGCDDPQTCTLVAVNGFPDPAPVSVPVCANMGTLPAGASCSSPLDCDAGLTCSAGTCRRICVVGSSCTGGPCTAIMPRAIVGTVEYGACPIGGGG